MAHYSEQNNTNFRLAEEHTSFIEVKKFRKFYIERRREKGEPDMYF